MPNKINPLTGKFDYYQDTASSLQEAKDYADSIVLGLLDDRGSFTPEGSYPSSGGSGTAGAIMKGDVWYVTGLGAGVTSAIGSVDVKDGDTVRALSDTPGQTASNWDVMSSPVNAITVQTLINSRTEQTSPADTDNIPITDGVSGNAFKRLTWSGVKSILKTYYDTIYTTTSAVASQITTALSGYITTSAANSTYSTKTLTIERKTASYVGVSADNNKLIEMNVATACTYTINNSIFSAGDQVLVSQYGAGQVTFVGGAGVTLRSASGKLKLTAQYSMATMVCIAANEFYISGDITA